MRWNQEERSTEALRSANVGTRYKVIEGSLGFQSDFSAPAFDLFAGAPLGISLLDNLYAGLSKYGASLGDIRVEAVGSLADVNVQAFLLSFGLIVRVRLDKIEVQSPDVRRINLERLSSIAADLLRTMKKVKPNLEFSRHTLTVDLHGHLEKKSPADFLSRFVTQDPKGIGPLVGKGVVYYLGAEGRRLMASVTVDLSQRVADALYFRVQAQWDGQKLEANEITSTAMGYFNEALASLELEM